jgi:hypothetical protein
MGVGVQNIAARRRLTDVGHGSLPPVPADIFARDAAQTFDAARAPAPWVRLAMDALRAERLELVGEPVLIRHRVGDRGLPTAPDDAEYRFAVDLTDARSSVTGGVLLFLDETGRGSGWRAEAGAITIWSGADPELTELVPGAPERLTLIGRARALSPGA